MSCYRVLVAQVGIVPVRVVVGSCRPLHHGHDADLQAAQVGVLVSVVEHLPFVLDSFRHWRRS